ISRQPAVRGGQQKRRTSTDARRFNYRSMKLAAFCLICLREERDAVGFFAGQEAFAAAARLLQWEAAQGRAGFVLYAGFVSAATRVDATPPTTCPAARFDHLIELIIVGHVMDAA